MANDDVRDIISVLFDALGMRKYIGMRYVPIFGRLGETSMDWDNTKPYEQLTVVLHNGNSYTSKQFVPIGVDITNTDFWALSGNYNAQVEEYKQAADSAAEEAHTATENVDRLESLLPDTEFTSENTVKNYVDSGIATLNNHMKIHALGNVASCYIIEYDNTFICYDISSTNADETTLRNAISEILGDSKFSCVICSHFHYDHCGKPAIIAEFCDDNTDVFMQMEPTSANGDIATYNQYKEAFVNVFTNATVPVNNSEHVYGNITVRLFNTDIDNRTTYDSTPHNASDDFLGLSSGLNNYSIIAEFTTPAGSYCNTGDCEGVAQEFNAQYMKHVDVLHNPHHVSNFTGYIQFFKNASPILVETAAEVSAGSTMRRRYTGLMLKAIGAPIAVTNNHAFTIDIHDGSVTHDSAYWTSADAPASVNSSHVDYYNFISAAYYNRDPFAVFRLTAAELVNLAYYQGVNGNYHLSTNTSGIDLEQSKRIFASLLANDADWLGITLDENGLLPDGIQLDFTITKNGILFKRATSATKSSYFSVEYMWLTSSTFATRKSVDGGYTRSIPDNPTYANTSDSLTIPSGTERYLYNAAAQGCVTLIDSDDTQYIIPVLRTSTAPNDTNNTMQGMWLQSQSRFIVVARITTSGKITGFKFFLDGTPSEVIHVLGYTLIK